MTAFMGCVFEYQSGSLIILAGDYGAGTPTQIATLSNFTMGSKIYVDLRGRSGNRDHYCVFKFYFDRQSRRVDHSDCGKIPHHLYILKVMGLLLIM